MIPPLFGDQFYSVIPVVLACSFVQSLFGVGLLVFGTPILLLLGFPFPMALLYLLPCSITISLFQVYDGRRKGERAPPQARDFFLYCIPLALVGLCLVLVSERSYNARVAVGLLLLLNSFVRFVKPLRSSLAQIVRKQTKSYLALIGLIHGLTNMGGGLLVIFANSLYARKESIRFAIAGSYLVLAIIQMVPLLFFHWQEVHFGLLIFPALAATVHLVIGNRVFGVSTEVVYQHLMTLLIFLFGVGLMVF